MEAAALKVEECEPGAATQKRTRELWKRNGEPQIGKGRTRENADWRGGAQRGRTRTEAATLKAKEREWRRQR